jgi:WD40 repeat protein
MWDYWLNNAKREQALDLDHYNGIGRMTEALSRHGDEVYKELPDDDHRLLCMKLFKAITEKQGDGRGVRRPLPFSEIDEITGHQREKILTVIDAYRPIGRTFIMPGENVKIHDKIIIDISHESLMRVWQRLKNWVNDEADSARIYIRLCETAQLHNRGEAGFYRDPDLKIALAWRDNNKPNANWGTRINDSFELAMLFLDDSREDFEAEQKAKEEARKRELEQAKALAKAERERAEIQRKSAKRNKVFAVFLFALACLAGFMAYQATQAEERAVASEGKAKKALSDSQLQEAERLVDRNEPQNAIGLLTKSYRNNPDYPILLNRAFSIADTQKISTYKGVVMDIRAHVLLDAGRGFQYDENLDTVALLHKEKGKSFVSVYDLKNEKELFQTPLLDIAESINYSNDGRYLVVACKGKEGWDGVIVYDVKSGKEIKRLETTPSPAIFGAVSNDLSDLAAGTSNGEVFHVDTLNNKRKKILQTDGDIWEVKIHPKNRTLAIVEVKDRATYQFHLINLQSNKTKLLFSSPEQEQRFFSQCRFSITGEYLVLHGGNNEIGSFVIYDGNTGKELLKDETTHTGAIFHALFSPDETIMATTSRDRTLRFWNLKTLSNYGKVMTHNAEAWKGVFSPDQTKFSVFTSNGELAIWDIETGILTHSYIKHENPIIMTAFSKDGQFVYSGSTNGQIHKWRLNENSRLPVLFTHDHKLLNIQVDQKTGLVATSAEDGTVKVWDPKSTKLKKVLQVEDNPVENGNVWFMWFDKDSKLFATVSSKSPFSSLKFNLWSWPDLEAIADYTFPEETSTTAFSPAGNQVAFANQETFNFSIYEIMSRKIVYSNQDHGDQIFGMNFSRDGKLLATACIDGYARVYSTTNFERICPPLPFGFNFGANVEFSVDGKYLLTRTNLGRDSNNAVIWDLEDGKEKFRLKHSSGVFNHFFSYDKKRVYTCGKDNVAKMWSLENGSLLGVFKQSQYVLSTMEFESDYNKILTLDKLGNARIWNTTTQKLVDGPFGGVSGDFWLLKGMTIPNDTGFVVSYGVNSAAYWPAPISQNSLINLESEATSFFENYAGGEIDKNSSFKFKDRNSIVRNDLLQSFKTKDQELNRWLNWKSNKLKKNLITYNGELTKEKLTEFLIAQDTLVALKAALVISPMNPDIMKKIGVKYNEKSKDNLGSVMSEFYSKKSNWYSRMAVEWKND